MRGNPRDSSRLPAGSHMAGKRNRDTNYLLPQRAALAPSKIFKISSLDTEVDTQKAKGKGGKYESHAATEGVESHMSTFGTYLLLSAFLASRNAAMLDASLFYSTGSLHDHKRRRRN
ncbi:Origin recognition complex subunit 5 [Ancistrocladus abbreviatus]